MKIILAGGTGFIGKALAAALEKNGHKVLILTRQGAPLKGSANIRYVSWNPPDTGEWEREVETADGLINLAGESIVAKRWTKAQKLKIMESRCDATQALVHAIRKVKTKPKVLVNASAVGFYGPRGDETLTEKDGPGNDFLAQTCKAWEAHAIRARDFGLRVVRARIGIVLDEGGGALAKMLPPFRMFLGGPLGNGRQWMSWIQLQDGVGLLQFALENPKVEGPLNTTAPHPVTMNEFAKTLGGVLGRPAVMRAPALALKVLLGEMSDMLLTGQKVHPEKALNLGYKFLHPTLREALEASLR